MRDSVRWQAYPLLKEYMPKGHRVVSVKYGTILGRHVCFLGCLGCVKIDFWSWPKQFLGCVPRCTLYYRVDCGGPVTHIKGGALTGCVRLGWIGAIDTRGAVERGLDDVASNRFHWFLGCLPPSILRVGAGYRQSRGAALAKSERKVKGAGNRVRRVQSRAAGRPRMREGARVPRVRAWWRGCGRL